MLLLSAEQSMLAHEIASTVRRGEETVRLWIKRFNAEGIEGLSEAPRPGAESKVTQQYRERLLHVVRRRPRSLDQPYSRWTLRRLADFMAEETGLRLCHETVRRVLKSGGIVLSRPQHKIFSPDPEYEVKKAIEDKRDHLESHEVFYYADEFNLSWQPTLKAIWSPVGQQVMIPAPGQPKKHYGIGAVNYHTGETVVVVRRRKRRKIAELLERLLEKHPTETIYVAWTKATAHFGDEVGRGAAGRLVLLYLPTYSPWLNPIAMLWRHFRREVTHCELFERIKALVQASKEFFQRYNQMAERVLLIIGAESSLSP